MDAPELQHQYLSTIAQIIPVLGLALVLEARASAAHWTRANKVRRRIESVLFYGIAVTLSILFGLVLILLATETMVRPGTLTFLSYLLVIVFLLLVWNPILVMATRANIDIAFWPLRAAPWTEHGRKRRIAVKTLKAVDDLLEKSRDFVQLALQISASVQKTMSSEGLLPTSGKDYANVFTADNVTPELRKIIKQGELQSAGAKYDERPTIRGARRIRKLGQAAAAGLLDHARGWEARALNAQFEMRNVLHKLNTEPYSPEDAQLIDESIARAPQAAAMFWDIHIATKLDWID